mmetsp:Transcript_9718/g.21646  ORF Transcript_9718/g.21646 Transcript_9718/m.21646 type:complete len:510 (-) Transcript_9718:292-1821(-)
MINSPPVSAFFAALLIAARGPSPVRSFFRSLPVRPSSPSPTRRDMFFEKQTTYDRFGSERERKAYALAKTNNHTDLLTNPIRIVQPPEPVAPRTGKPLTGTAFVSGWCDDPTQSDQFVFDLLHRGETFAFDRIECFCDDAVLSKKLLSSRSARNTGLLDVLAIVQAPEPGGLPLPVQLFGVSAWVARLASPSVAAVRAVAATASEAAVEQVAVLLEGPVSPEEAAEMEAVLQEESEDGDLFDFSLLHANAIVDGREGEGYRLANFTNAGEVASPASSLRRDEAVRILAEMLSLDACAGRCLSAADADPHDSSSIWIRALRSGGYTRPQETEALVSPFDAMKNVAFYEFARADQARYKGLVEGTITLTPEERAAREAESRRRRRKEYKRLVKSEVEERQKEILAIAFQKLKVTFDDSKFRRGAITEEEWNQLYFSAFLDEAIFIWDSRNGGRKKRPEYHTEYDILWKPQMIAKYGKPPEEAKEETGGNDRTDQGGMGGGISSDFTSPFGL